MDDPFFADDDGDFDDFYGTKATNMRASKARKSNRTTPAAVTTPSMVYPDTPASSVASFMSKSTDGGVFSASFRQQSTELASPTSKTAKKSRRRRSQDRFDVEWEKDDDVTSCFVCSNEFSLLKRKHHCRHCGRVICSDCSSYWRFTATRKKHRVCSYCKVELANDGTGRQTMADHQPLSDAEATPNTQADDGRRRSKLRQSIAGVFGTTSAEKKPVQPVTEHESANDRASRSKKTRPPSSDLFNTADDTWFADPVHEDEYDHKKGRKSAPGRASSTSRAQPIPSREPASIFDVQFTDNQSDESDSGDTVGMPVPMTTSTRSSQLTNGRRTSTKRSDAPMTLDELHAEDNDDSNPLVKSSSHVTFTGPLIPPSLKNKASDRPTFYDANADAMVVDDSPGFYESMRASQHHSSTHREPKLEAPAMPRPTILTPASDDSSAVMVEASEPSTSSASPSVEDRTKESSGFTGALKRFFGMSHAKPSKAEKEATPSSSVIQPEVLAPAAPSAYSAVSPQSPTPAISMTMPVPRVVAVPPTDDQDDTFTYDDIAHRREQEQAEDRYTMVDSFRFRDTHSASSLDAAPLRHTMGGYLAPVTTGLADSVVRATIAGRSTLTGATALYDQVDPLNQSRSSTRNRRDTFDDLFDSPTKQSRMAPIGGSMMANLPGREWVTDSFGASRGIGVDRFDRPRSEEPEDEITKGLGLPSGLPADRMEPVKTSWSAVSSFRGTGVAPAYAVPGSYSDARAETSISTSYDRSSARVSRYDGSDNRYIDDDADAVAEIERRTIMDDLRVARPSASEGSFRQKQSVDDYFADFEKKEEYVFDTVTGTYVTANTPRPSPSRERLRDESSRASQATNTRRDSERPSKREKHRSSVRTVPPALESVDEGEPDEIDGIIADKISTLAGELEALKNLLKQRRAPRSPSSARRKQSIFDSDGSSEEEKKVAPKKSTKRRPSSRKEKSEKPSRQARRDSFASLFEDDPVDDKPTKKALGTSNLEALFQLGTKDAGDAENSEGEKPFKGLLKPSKRGSRRGKKTESDDEPASRNESHEDEDTASRFRKKPSSDVGEGSSIFKAKSGRRSKKTQSDDELDTLPEADVTALAIVSHPATNRKQMKPKKDEIDALFDSGSDGDMESLFETKPVTKPSSTEGVAAGTADIADLTHSSGDEESDSRRKKKATNAPSDKSSSVAIRRTSSKPDIPVENEIEATPTRGESSDEEFTSTLKTLRHRRRSKPASSKRVSIIPIVAEELQPTIAGDETAVVGSSSRLSTSSDEALDYVPAAVPSVALSTLFSAENDDDSSQLADSTRSEDEDAGQPVDDDDDQEAIGVQVVKEQVEFKSTSMYSEDAGNDAVSDSEPAVESKLPVAEFDPLALSDEDEPQFMLSKRTKSQRSKTQLPVSAPPPEQTAWSTSDSDITTFASRLKTNRFRDSLLDNDDLLGPAPSLNLDDLLSDSTGEPSIQHRGSASSSSDEEPVYSFEIKPKKRTKKPDEPPVEATPPAEDLEPDTLPVDAPASIDDEPRGLASTVVDDELASVPVDTTLYQDDWQKLQDMEKERKKKLQLKQRQAQREKLKKQPNSGRTLSKLGSSRGPSNSLSSAVEGEETTDAGDDGAQKKRTKKKAHRHAEEDTATSSRRKTDKHRRRRDTEATQSSTTVTTTEPSALTEL